MRGAVKFRIWGSPHSAIAHGFPSSLKATLPFPDAKAPRFFIPLREQQTYL